MRPAPATLLGFLLTLLSIPIVGAGTVQNDDLPTLPSGLIEAAPVAPTTASAPDPHYDMRFGPLDGVSVTGVDEVVNASGGAWDAVSDLDGVDLVLDNACRFMSCASSPTDPFINMENRLTDADPPPLDEAADPDPATPPDEKTGGQTTSHQEAEPTTVHDADEIPPADPPNVGERVLDASDPIVPPGPAQINGDSVTTTAPEPLFHPFIIATATLLAVLGATAPALAASGTWAKLTKAVSLRRALFAFIGLFARIEQGTVLVHPSRRLVFDLISGNPGICLEELSTRSRLSRSVVVYHTHILLRHALVVANSPHKNRHFFPKLTYGEKERRTLAQLNSERARAIVRFLQDTPGSDQLSICRKVGIRPNRVGFYLRRLNDVGLLEGRREGKHVRWAPTPILDRYLKLLESNTASARNGQLQTAVTPGSARGDPVVSP